jgi:DNA-binding transcriptional regulator YhcF (GntR family)
VGKSGQTFQIFLAPNFVSHPPKILRIQRGPGGFGMARNLNGYVKLYRSTAAEDIIQRSPETLCVWIQLLSWANYGLSVAHFDKEQVHLGPGQLVTSIDDLSFHKKCRKNKVRGALRYLEETGRIHTRKCTRGTLITVCKWEEYQFTESEITHQITNGSQTDHKQITNGSHYNKNITNKEIKNKTVFDFDSVYRDHYPNKTGKDAGMKECKKQILSAEDFEIWKNAVINYGALCRKEKKEKKYILHFSTFMSKRRWKDEIEDQATPVALMDTL